MLQVYRELRKREIVRMSDQIIEGKRRKLNVDKHVDQSKSQRMENADSSSPGPSGESNSKNDGKENQDSSSSNEENIQNEHLTKSADLEEKKETVEDEEDMESREDILEKEFSKIKDIPRHQEILQTFNCEFSRLSLT
jgi:hypothetical protein